MEMYTYQASPEPHQFPAEQHSPAEQLPSVGPQLPVAAGAGAGAGVGEATGADTGAGGG